MMRTLCSRLACILFVALIMYVDGSARKRPWSEIYRVSTYDDQCRELNHAGACTSNRLPNGEFSCDTLYCAMAVPGCNGLIEVAMQVPVKDGTRCGVTSANVCRNRRCVFDPHAGLHPYGQPPSATIQCLVAAAGNWAGTAPRRGVGSGR